LKPSPPQPLPPPANRDPKRLLPGGCSSGILRIVKVENDSRFHLQHLKLMDPVARPLTSVALNKSVRIERLDGPHQDCARLLDLGFTPGEEISVTQWAPLGDPLVVRVRGALLALRKREAAWILVE
jgi:ferrous iron transport protein A